MNEPADSFEATRTADPRGPADLAAARAPGLDTTSVRPAAPAVRQPRNAVALLLSTVTGLGHFYLDHYLTGALLFGLFVTAINGMFLGFTLQSTSSPLLLRALSILLFVVVWTFGVWHAYRLSYGTDRAGLARARDALLREGLVHYLRDDLEDAVRKLERAVALDIDWHDPDPLFHLGVAYARLAERRALRMDEAGAREAQRRAHLAFKQCLGRDPRRKWRAEVEDEQARMRPRTLTARLRKVGGVLKDAFETASGAFVRPLAWTIADDSQAQPGPVDRAPGTDTVVDNRPWAATKKKRRFSAKYAASKAPDPSGLETRADPGTRRHGPGLPDPGAETKAERPPNRPLVALPPHAAAVPSTARLAGRFVRPTDLDRTTAAPRPGEEAPRIDDTVAPSSPPSAEPTPPPLSSSSDDATVADPHRIDDTVAPGAPPSPPGS